jgi:hypothetical protein
MVTQRCSASIHLVHECDNVWHALAHRAGLQVVNSLDRMTPCCRRGEAEQLIWQGQRHGRPCTTAKQQRLG